jgi:hypothetical protein
VGGKYVPIKWHLFAEKGLFCRHRDLECLLFSRHQVGGCSSSAVARAPGLPDFSRYNVPKRGKMYQMTTECTNWPYNIPFGHKIDKLVIKKHQNLLDIPKFTQIGIFGLNIWQHWRARERNGEKARARWQLLLAQGDQMDVVKTRTKFDQIHLLSILMHTLCGGKSSAQICFLGDFQ